MSAIGMMNEELTLVKERLVEKYKPEKIILFGSMARGRVRRNSDIDLMVIKNTSERLIKRMQRAAVIADTENVGCDIIVYTPREWQKCIDKKDYFFYGEIHKKGKVIYERRDKRMGNFRRGR